MLACIWGRFSRFRSEPFSNLTLIFTSKVSQIHLYNSVLNYYLYFGTEKEIPILNALTGVSWGVGAILGPIYRGGFFCEQRFVALGKSFSASRMSNYSLLF